MYRRRCCLCKGEISRSTQRYSCRHCVYNVCYDCAKQFAPPAGGSHSSQAKRGGACAPESESTPIDLRRGVVISKYYDIVDPEDGKVRHRFHSRKGFAIADDCRCSAFSGAQLTMSVRAMTGERETSPRQQWDAGCRRQANHESRRSGGAAIALAYCPPHYDALTSVGDAGQSLATDVVERAMQLVDVVAMECGARLDCFDRSWAPQLPGNGVAGDVAARPPVARDHERESILSWMLGGGDVLQKLLTLSAAAKAVLEQQPIVPEVAAPAKVFGDVHGQLRDLLLLFHFYGRPGETTKQDSLMAAGLGVGSPLESLSRPRVSFVFNGDWVDRGRHQLEVVAMLFALKICYPNSVWLNRGNHEDIGQNVRTSMKGLLGFDRACMDEFGPVFGEQAFKAVHNTFDWLPLATRIGGRALVLHGGLGRGSWTLEALRSVRRPLVSSNLTSALGGAVYNILWSDPVVPNKKRPLKSYGVHPSHRSKHGTVMKTFGRDVTQNFCKREGLGLVIRSHQFKKSGKGYELEHDGWLMRVFSARNYTGKNFNDGGLLLIGFANDAPGTLLVRPQNVQRIARPQGAYMSPGGQFAEPYCPRHHLMQLVEPRPKPGCMALTCMSRIGDENVECDECGAEQLEDGEFFHCPGCGGYDLCLHCAARLRAEAANGVGTPAKSHIFGSTIMEDVDSDCDVDCDSDSDSDFDQEGEFPEIEASWPPRCDAFVSC